MNAKHSAILLSGLVLLMIGIAWAQSSNAPQPTCPPLKDESLQQMLQPEAWVKAYWDANLSHWHIDCTQIDAIANMPAPYPVNSANAIRNAVTVAPRRNSNSNYVNTNPYKAPPDTNIYNGANANVRAVNANTVRPARSIKREPNTRRPGE